MIIGRRSIVRERNASLICGLEKDSSTRGNDADTRLVDGMPRGEPKNAHWPLVETAALADHDGWVGERSGSLAARAG